MKDIQDETAPWIQVSFDNLIVLLKKNFPYNSETVMGTTLIPQKEGENRDMTRH
jgi:hypothetical protein